MYEILVDTSSVFKIMMFPHDEKIITIDQFTYSVKVTLLAPDDVLPLVLSSHELITTYTELSTGQCKSSTLLGIFPGDPSMIEEISPTTGAPMCMMTS